MIVRKYKQSTRDEVDGISLPELSIFCDAEDVPNLPMEGMYTGVCAFIVDWYLLSKEEKSNIGNQLLVYSDARKLWVPQGSTI